MLKQTTAKAAKTKLFQKFGFILIRAFASKKITAVKNRSSKTKKLFPRYMQEIAIHKITRADNMRKYKSLNFKDLGKILSHYQMKTIKLALFQLALFRAHYQYC
jgi:hypothetical protein